MSAKSKSTQPSSRRLRRGKLALALALALLAPAAWAGVVTPPTPQPVPACPLCLPEIGNVASGSATSNLDLGGVMNPGPTGMDTLIITQTTNSAIINWNTFNVASGFAVYFDQPSATSVTLNRVIGGNPSFIQGTINATGSVFLVNTAGILFGSGAQVNVGGLVASTLDITDADFLAGLAMTNPHYIFSSPGGIPGTPIVNQGTITTDAGGTIALLAARIENQSGASLTAPGGSVVFGAAVGANLDFYGDGLTTVTLTGNGLALDLSCSSSPIPTSSCLGGIESLGNVTATGGHVEMRTTTSDGLPQPIGTALFTEATNGGRIWIGGTVSTPTTAARAGSIILDAGMGNVDIGGISGQAGVVRANASGAGQNAGTVEIDAYQLFTHVCFTPGLPGNCTGVDNMGWIDATAQGAGGNGGQITINLGGDFYHAGIIQSAAFQGNAGQIDITAAGTAEIHNWIMAESGTGNGGTINLSADTINLYRGQRPWLGGPGILYSQAVLSTYGANNGGTVNLNFTNMVVTDLGDVTPADPEYASIINVRGMNGNGGTVNAIATGIGGGLSILPLGAAPDPWFANANGAQNGGTITLQAPSMYIRGNFSATGGTGNGGSINITGNYVTLGGNYDLRASGTWGDLFTAADSYLGVGSLPINVFAKDWSIFSGEVWVTTPGAFGSYTSGVVITDAALATAIGNGTYVRLLADNTTYTGDPSFGGNVNFVDSTSVNVTGTGLGGAAFTAFGDIFGTNFALTSLNAAMGLQFSTGGTIQFSNFSLNGNGGDVSLYAGNIQLNAGTIAGSMFHAEANGSGIIIDGGSTISAGQIELIATGASNGIVIDGSDLTAGGDILVDAENSGDGIAVFASQLHSTAGDVYLNAANSVGGILLDGGSVIQSGAGDIHLDAGNSDGGIQVYNASQIISDTAGVSLLASGSNSGIVMIGTGTRVEAATNIVMNADASSAGGISIYSGAEVVSHGGDIALTADGSLDGITLSAASIHSYGGDITMHAASASGGGFVIQNATTIDAGGGAILLDAAGGDTGININNSVIASSTGNITFDVSSNASGIGLSGGSLVSSDSGTITVNAVNSGGGIFVNASDIASNGGAILLDADNAVAGIQLLNNSIISSDAGAITLSADGSNNGIAIRDSQILSLDGAITVAADNSAAGVNLDNAAITTTSGAIFLGAEGSGSGISLTDSDLASTTGRIELAGRGTSGAGVNLDAGSSINAGSGTVIIRAGNDGSSDAIVLAGQVASTTAVNLRPLDATDTLYLGGGNGFVLDNLELSNIHAPWLVLGSTQHQGAIQVLSNIAYAGNLSLQNQGGTAGIHLGGMLDVSGYTLGLFAGGSIDQTTAGIIRAESLVAVASGDVLLATVQNDVTGNTLAGSAGGRFEYLDGNDLAIGNVAAFGFNASTGALSTMNGAGISAGGNVLVRNMTGNLTLRANVSGADVDLVTAGVFLNPAGASISASGSWRVWASTWVGEDRGGLAGSGNLPNLYNCTYGGACGVTVGSGNHFIYTMQPNVTISVDDVSREYGDSDPVFQYTVSGLVFADDNPLYVLSALLSSGTDVFSNVGTYAINGSFTSLAGYGFSFTPGTLTITPATLTFTADPLTWYMGMPFPAFTGTVTGFKNSDTLASVFGPGGIVWGTSAGPLSGPGYYSIFGGGTGVLNYVFAQSPSNLLALQILPLAQPSDTPFEFIADPVETFVYESNFETVAMCPITVANDDGGAEGGDGLGNEWSKVRKRLNLVNCFSNDRRGGCGSF